MLAELAVDTCALEQTLDRELHALRALALLPLASRRQEERPDLVPVDVRCARVDDASDRVKSGRVHAPGRCREQSEFARGVALVEGKAFVSALAPLGVLLAVQVACPLPSKLRHLSLRCRLPWRPRERGRRLYAGFTSFAHRSSPLESAAGNAAGPRARPSSRSPWPRRGPWRASLREQHRSLAPSRRHGRGTGPRGQARLRAPARRAPCVPTERRSRACAP